MAYQSMDFPQLFAVAQQMREGRLREQQAQQQNLMMGMQLREAERKAELSRILPKARELAMKGDPSMLQRLAPDEWRKMQEAELDIKAKKAGIEKTTGEVSEMRRKVGIEKATATSRALYDASQLVAQNPQVSGMIEGKLREMAKRGEIDISEDQIGIVTPERLQQLSAMADKRAEGLATPELTPAQREIAPELSPAYAAHPERALTDPRYAAAMEKRRKAGGFKVSIGTGEELKGAAEAKAVTGIADAYSASQRLKDIRSRWDTSMNEFGAQFLGAVVRGVSGFPLIGRIPSEARKDWANRQKYVQGAVRDLFLEYKVEKTGAAATDKELQRIMGATLEEGQDPATFQVNLNRSIRALDVRMAMYGELIDQGAPRTLEEMRSFREKMGIRVRSAERDAATERFRELEKQGLSQPDIHQALIQEGYITRPEVKR